LSKGFSEDNLVFGSEAQDSNDYLIFNTDDMTLYYDKFEDWYGDDSKDRQCEYCLIKESEIKILKGLIHFAKKAPKNERGFTKLNLIDVQNDSMKELGFLIKPEETLGLAEKKIIAEHIMEEGGGLSTIFMIEDLEKVTPFWEIIYGVAKLKR
jgi:hypothetical protein